MDFRSGVRAIAQGCDSLDPMGNLWARSRVLSHEWVQGCIPSCKDKDTRVCLAVCHWNATDVQT